MKFCILISFLAAAVFQPAFTQTRFNSSLDWESRRLHFTATQPLEPQMSPADHPQALAELERQMPAWAAGVVGELPWNHRGTVNDFITQRPEAAFLIDMLIESMVLEWSRLTGDHQAVEVSYYLDLKHPSMNAIPAESLLAPAALPMGWIPLPMDDWTGIVIYAPPELPVRGTGLTANPQPALRARILSPNLEVLLDSAAGGGVVVSYARLANRGAVEGLVGRRPYRTMARGLYGEYPCDIILGAEDAQRILAAESGRRALSEGRVVILLDDLPIN